MNTFFLTHSLSLFFMSLMSLDQLISLHPICIQTNKQICNTMLTSLENDPRRQQQSLPYHFCFRVPVLGSSRVGKSLLIQRRQQQLRQRASSSSSTPAYDDPKAAVSLPQSTESGIQIYKETFEDRGVIFQMQLWDTPGSEVLKRETLRMCGGMAAAIVVFDVFNRMSFDAVQPFVDALELNRSIDKVLVGNKIDFRSMRAVSEKDARTLAQQNGFCNYFEASALDNRARGSAQISGENAPALHGSASTGGKIEDIFDYTAALVADTIHQGWTPQSLRSKGITIGSLFDSSQPVEVYRWKQELATSLTVRPSDVSPVVDWL